MLEPLHCRRHRTIAVTALIGLASLANACAAPPSSDADPSVGQTEIGWVSYYGERFAGRPTANGEPFDPRALTMAHRQWPFGARVRVTNLDNQRSVTLRINDRGPSIKTRIADVSAEAARRLNMLGDGVVRAKLEIVALPTMR
ncbi:MAG: septal ring lytic transglycosylase RlpA family protein [Burkholderiaceae bacterium]